MSEVIVIKLSLAHAERLAAGLAEYLEFLRNVHDDCLQHGEELPDVMTLAGRRHTADHVHTKLIAALAESSGVDPVELMEVGQWQSN